MPFGSVVKMLPTRSSLPILGRLLVDDGHIGMTDYTVSYRSTVETVGETVGPFLLSGDTARRVARAVSKVKAEPVVHYGETVRDTKIHVGKYSFPVWDADMPDVDQYPVLPVRGETFLTVDRDTFVAGLASVKTSVGKDGTVPMLLNVFFDFSEGFRMVATDRHRLTVVDVLDEPVNCASLLVPFADLDRLVSGMDGDTVILSRSEMMLGLNIGDDFATIRLSDDSFVKYAGLMPVDPVHAFDFVAEDLWRDLDVIGCDKHDQGMVWHNGAGWQVCVPGNGTGPVHTCGGMEWGFALNPAWMKDLASVFGKKNTVSAWRFSSDAGHAKPVLFTGGNVRHLLMPMQLSEGDSVDKYFR